MNMKRSGLILVVLLTITLILVVTPVSAIDRVIGNTTPGGVGGAISNATDNDTVVLSPGTYFEHNIRVTKNITIRAEIATGTPVNTIIDAQAMDRVFNVTGTYSLSIDNLTLRNGHAPDGTNGSYAGNGTAGGDGGAIYSSGPVTVTSSTITNCSTGAGGPFSGIEGDSGSGGNGGNGGAIFTPGNVTVLFSAITDCSAGTGGWGSDIAWSTGTGGSGGNGGALYSMGMVTITSSSITGCAAGAGGDGNQGGSGGNGGAIYSFGSVMAGSTTIANCSSGHGGDRNGQGIDSAGGDGGNGGAIFSLGPVALSSSTITLCSAGDSPYRGNGGRGGAVYSDDPVTLTNSSITGCNAGSGGVSRWAVAGGFGGSGGAVYSTDSVTMTNSMITGCMGGNGSGHANAPGAPYPNSESSVNAVPEGSSQSGGSGGAIYSAGPVMMTNSTITGCMAGDGGSGRGSGGEGGSGGAICSTSTVTMMSSTITGCNAGPGGSSSDGGTGGSGGAIFSTGMATVTNSTITGCNAGPGGSHIIAYGSGTGGNGGSGGAVYAGDMAALTSSTVTTCSAGTGGIGGVSDSPDGTDGNGSAVFSTGNGTLHFNRISGNTVGVPVILDGTGSRDASDNWWGSNTNSSVFVNPGVISSPWLMLGITAMPSSLIHGQTSTITVNLTYDSDGISIGPMTGQVPDGIPVMFVRSIGNGDLLIFSAGTITNGTNTTMFTPVTTSGTTTINATIDGQTVSTVITITSPGKIGVFRPSTHMFFLDFNGNGAWNGAAMDRAYNFGLSGDVPVSGDWNQDGVTEIGVFRPSAHMFFLDYSGNGAWNGAATDRAYNFGLTGDIPVTGDWNHNGTSEIGVFRPSTHMFYLDYNGNGAWNGAATDRAYNFGLAGDIPVTGDWNNDGATEIGVYRPSTHSFYLDYNGNGAWNGAAADRAWNFGIAGDIPLSGDWNNNGIPEIGVFRPSTHIFYLDYNGNGAWNGGLADRSYNLGLAGDKPVSGRW